MINILNKRKENIKEKYDIILSALIMLGSLLIPTFLSKVIPLGSNPQLIIGTIVNTMLIFSALYLNGKTKILTICTMPSISTILGGILFNNASIYSKFMIPFIWLGNFTFIYIYKKLYIEKNKNYILASIISIITKITTIYLGFQIISLILNPPEKIYNTLNIAMSLTQLITATLAASLVYIIINIKRRTKK